MEQRINNIRVNLQRMPHEELVNMRGYCETRVAHSLEDIIKINTELAGRAGQLVLESTLGEAYTD